MFHALALLDMAEQFDALASKKKKKKWTPISKKHRKAILKAFNDSVGECIEHMEDKVKTPGAFCSSLKDSVKGTSWRQERRKNKKEATLRGKDWIKQTPDGTLFIDNIQLDRDKLNAMNNWQDLVDMGVSRNTISRIVREYNGHPRNVDTWLEQNSTPYVESKNEEEKSKPLEKRLSDQNLHYYINDMLNNMHIPSIFYVSFKYPLTEDGLYSWRINRKNIIVEKSNISGISKMWKTKNNVDIDHGEIFTVLKSFINGLYNKYFYQI